MSEVDNDKKLAPSQRRLQREPDFTGSKLSSFREVALRHGLPGAILGVLCLALPETRAFLGEGLSELLANPMRGLVGFTVIFIGLNAYAWYIDRSWRIEKAGWVFYLGAVSAWEEWVFRLAVPYYAESLGMQLMVAVVISNLIFGIAHYFTLRWKWQWCVAAFIGGMALSRQFDEHGNLMAVIFIHWIATFINTPRLPGSSRANRKGSEGRYVED